MLLATSELGLGVRAGDDGVGRHMGVPGPEAAEGAAAGAVEGEEDERFLKLVESQETMRATCQQQLDEARQLHRAAERKAAEEAVARRTAEKGAAARKRASSAGLPRPRPLARDRGSAAFAWQLLGCARPGGVRR